MVGGSSGVQRWTVARALGSLWAMARSLRFIQNSVGKPLRGFSKVLCVWRGDRAVLLRWDTAVATRLRDDGGLGEGPAGVRGTALNTVPVVQSRAHERDFLCWLWPAHHSCTQPRSKCARLLFRDESDRCSTGSQEAMPAWGSGRGLLRKVSSTVCRVRVWSRETETQTPTWTNAHRASGPVLGAFAYNPFPLKW